MRDRLHEFFAQGGIHREDELRIRSLYRYLSFYLDTTLLMGEAYRASSKVPYLPHDSLARAFFHPDLQPELEKVRSEKLELRDLIPDGSIILTRGGPSSIADAMIARLPQVAWADSRWSHAFIFRHNEVESYALEALIEDGFRRRPVLDPLQKTSEKLSAMLVLAPYDSKLRKIASLGAERLEELLRIAESDRFPQRGIRYNFSMQALNREALLRGVPPESLYCSQAVDAQFLLGSGGEVQLPQFQTIFQGNQYLQDRLNIAPGTRMIAPGDLEVDPRFQLLMYFVNPTRAHDARISNATMDVFYEFIEEGYEF